MRACVLQVTTFKVRTIRSQGGSTDQASASRTWTTAEDGSLDAAAGGHDQLLARAMSIAGACSGTSCVPSPSLALTIEIFWYFDVRKSFGCGRL